MAGCGESFTAGTSVLLASGAALPISQLQAGDKVLATNTKTGKTQAEPVAAVMVKRDTNRYDLTIKTAQGSAVIDTTRRHLFWDVTQDKWVKAGKLHRGDQLRTSNGATATVAGGRAPADTTGWMWDISVPGGGDHDFYIDVATTAVLVHNCDIGHADIHQYPGIQAGKSQFFDQEDLGSLSDTSGNDGILQDNGNMRYVLSRAEDIGVDRTTGLPTNIYTVIRTASGRVVTLFPGTSPMG